MFIMLYNNSAILLFIFILLCIEFLWLIFTICYKSVLLNTITLIFPSLPPVATILLSVFYRFNVLRFHI